MGKIFVVGIGPGEREFMTAQADAALCSSDIIIGYSVYTDLIKEHYPDKELLSTSMGRERERCVLCLEKAREGKTVSLVCSGDPGVYGMASLMLEVAGEADAKVDIEIVPGVSAAMSAGARLGAPTSDDFCVISLSDHLTPWEVIERRLRAAAEGDFSIVIYNPMSKTRPDHLRRACDILLESIEPERPCGYVENAGRKGERAQTCTLSELRTASLNMFTTVFIGSGKARIIAGRLVTPRGYRRTFGS